MSARGGDRVTFAVRLTGVLAENGWSSAEAARRGKTSDANLSRWLKKGIVPDLATLDPIARRWGYSAVWLLTGEGDRRARPSDPQSPLDLIGEAIGLLRRAALEIQGQAPTPNLAPLDLPLDQGEAIEEEGRRVAPVPPPTTKPQRRRRSG